MHGMLEVARPARAKIHGMQRNASAALGWRTDVMSIGAVGDDLSVYKATNTRNQQLLLRGNDACCIHAWLRWQAAWMNLDARSSVRVVKL